MLIDEGTPVAASLASPWEAMLAYNRLRVIAEFLIAVICSSMNVSRRVDVSVAFRISLRRTWLLIACLVFSMNVDEA